MSRMRIQKERNKWRWRMLKTQLWLKPVGKEKLWYEHEHLTESETIENS